MAREFTVTELADDGHPMGVALRVICETQLEAIRAYNNQCATQGVTPARTSISVDGDQTIGVPECNCDSTRGGHSHNCEAYQMDMAVVTPAFKLPERVTLEVEGNGFDPDTQSFRIPEYAFTIPELDVRVGPLFDGSGRREEFPNGIIRTTAEARAIAQEIVNRWNAV